MVCLRAWPKVGHSGARLNPGLPQPIPLALGSAIRRDRAADGTRTRDASGPTSDPAHPMIVDGFMPRDADGFKIEETWDVLGMRATRSDDTVLDGVFVPDRFISRR